MFKKFVAALIGLLVYNNFATAQTANACTIQDLPSIQFSTGKISLDPQARKLLDTVATVLKTNTACNIRIISITNNGTPTQAQMSYDRMYSIAAYFQMKGISKSRLILEQEYFGDPLFTDLVMVNKTDQVAPVFRAPMPCYSFHKKINGGKRCVDAKGNFINR